MEESARCVACGKLAPSGEAFDANLRALLLLDEGKLLKPRRCTKGKLTIGIGRNLDDCGITNEEALFLFENDIKRVIQELSKALPDVFCKLVGARRAALIDLAFNLGTHKLLTKFPRFVAAARAENWEEAAYHLTDSDWYQEVKSRGPRIVGMIRSGNWWFEIGEGP